MEDRNDIIVIGGGLAGLVTAALAARAGSRVTLLEGHALGGRARTTGHEGFGFNLGPHALYEGAELMTTLAELAVPFHGSAPSTRIVLEIGGRVERLPVDARSLLRTGAVTGRARVATASLLAGLRSGRGPLPTGLTLDEWLAERRLPEEAAALVRMLCRVGTYSNAPDLIDAGAAVLQLRRAVRGVRYLDGGWQSLVVGLADRAAALGAVILDHQPVVGLERTGRRWTVATPAGEHRAASIVLAAGGPEVAARLLGVEPAALGAAGPPVRAACLDLGLAAPTRDDLRFGVDEPLYYSTHMPPARLAPEGSVVVHVARYLRPEERPTAATRDDLWAFARRAGVGEGGAEVRAHRYLHDMVVAHGLPLAATGGLAGRPPVAVAEAPGAFLAGDWVGGTALLADAAAASGRLAADLAARHAAAVPA